MICTSLIFQSLPDIVHAATAKRTIRSATLTRRVWCPVDRRRHAVCMTRVLKVIILLAVASAGLFVCVIALVGQGLDRAEKWVSMIGMVVSVVIGVIGVVVARSDRASRDRPRRAVRRTGDASATGRGSFANTGAVRAPDALAEDTGSARAEKGGRANTGVQE